jgi:nucleoside-diphosphate-sugar epimerase
MNSLSRQLVVTGASGFLGSEIVGLARASGWHVRILDRNPRMQVEGVEILLGDIGDSRVLRNACEGASAIVHAAGLAHVFGPGARDSARFNLVNELGTANVVDAALKEGVSHIILVSSVSVYGDYLGTRCDETVPCYPKGPYAMSKWKGELRATERMADGRGSLTILRFATIYGEGDRGNVARLIRALESKRFIWSGSGQNQKSLIYKEDAARACLCALDRHESAVGVFNVSAPPSTMREIVTAICEVLGRPVPRLSLPLSVLRTAGAISRKIGDPWDLDQRLQRFVRDDVYDGSKFEARFGFCPAVSLSEGLRKEVDSLRSQPKR